MTPQKQFLKDRSDYSNMLMLNAQMASAKTQDEASKQAADNVAKIFAVFRSMCKGDIVPSSDERKLIEYDDKMYQLAKQAQMITITEKRKRKKSEWDDDEERANKEKLDQLNRESGEALQRVGTGTAEFADAQLGNIVELSAEGMDGGGFDISI